MCALWQLCPLSYHAGMASVGIGMISYDLVIERGEFNLEIK